VWFIRLFGITVFLEGNVIDLGTYKLQVAEACSGLRYLFPLMTIGFIMAYLFKVETWKRVLVFVSSIPITILMNSFRIGIIGVTVDRWGVRMAEGFLHDFEGWVVFMASSAVLLAEVAVLARVGKVRHWRDVFGLERQRAPETVAALTGFRWLIPFAVGTAVIAATAGLVVLLPERIELIPERATFAAFSPQADDWHAQRETIERVYVDTLKFDDYVMANYFKQGKLPVNFYVAWYNSQRSGQSAHSPRSCLPGGGWKIEDSSVSPVKNVSVGGVPLQVNRALISSGSQQQLVYYWFQQRGRVITNEYAVKWYLFWDALTRNRTDGALVRLIIPITPDVGAEQAEATLTEFLQSITPELPRFVPG
jgi:exosortase D (VPLPA-CTERM-specific)